MLVDFPAYNKKLTPRMAAIGLFYERHSSELSENSRDELYQKVKCETSRSRGDIVGILLSKTSLINRLRALSACNSFFYNLRKKLYGLLSGW
jgi:hypothetical protein